MIKRAALLLGVFGATLLAGCGADDGAAVTASASASGAPSEDCKVEGGVDAARDAEVHVELDEYSIKVDETSVAAGNVEFHTTNKGKEPHELVIVEGATPDQLTIGATGLDEAKLPAGAKVLGEIEPFVGHGGVCTGVFTLAAGDYTLLCNIVEPSGMKHAHATEGMVTAFTVS
jgi:plastocyanin